uniref:RNA-directed RNA polymerase n=1 Tax=Xining Chuvi tick virus 1 TaxID=2972093 RepID=A0A9E7V235_9VIRU|nr:MAG: polymerase [Xining Chuvi tick virus 1]
MFLSQKGHQVGTAHQLLLDRKFDTALRESQVIAFLDRAKLGQSTEDDLLITHHHPCLSNFHTDDTYVSHLVLNLFGRADSAKTVAAPVTPRIMSLIASNLRPQVDYNMQVMDGINLPNPQTLLDKIPTKTHRLITHLAEASLELSKAVEEMGKIHEYHPHLKSPESRIFERVKHNRMRLSYLGVQLTWSTRLLVIQAPEGTWVTPRPYLMLLQNKISDILSVLLTVATMAGTSLEISAVTTTTDFIKEMNAMHVKYRGKFFDLARSLEGLVTSIILYRSEEWVNATLLETLIADLSQLLPVKLEDTLLYKILGRASTPLLSELACLTKVGGHPMVDMPAGTKRINEKVMEPLVIKLDAVASCISHIKKNYVQNFVVRYGRWPATDLDVRLAHPALKYAHSRGLDPCSSEVSLRFGELSDHHWSAVELLPELKFAFTENILPLLKDRAISVTRSKVLEQYLSHEAKKKRLDPKELRLILFYLFASPNEVDHITYLHRYMESDRDLESVLDYLVIRLVPKERELKPEFRGFGCKTFLDRARSIIQETNVMAYLHLTSDEQAMTLNELALAKKIQSLRNLKAMYPNHRVVKINFDATAWNNKFRAETVDHVMAHTLDAVYDVSLFCKTQAAFEKSLVYVPDELHTTYWEGQLGGIEGLNQDTWVLVYLAQIKKAFADVRYIYHLLAKGDDLRACVPIPAFLVDNTTMNDQVKDLVERVSSAAEEFGHEIKVTDSYASEVLLTFSKTVYLDNLTLPYTFRKIQKCYGINNSFLPVLDDFVAASYSTAHSACAGSTVTFPLYITALYWVFFYLTTHPVYCVQSNIDLVALTLVPSVVGGLPIIYLHNMFVRAESDLLGAFVGFYQFLARRKDPLAEKMAHFLAQPRGTVSKVQLLQDPYSLPIQRPMTAANYLKKVVLRTLSRRVPNAMIKQLLTMYSTRNRDTLVAALESGKEWPAKVYSILYCSSPFQLVEELLMQFLTAKSIRELLIVSRTRPKQANRILTTALKKDHSVHLWRLKILRGVTPRVERPYLLTTSCPADATQRLRDEMWDTHVSTITYPPVQHQIRIMTPAVGARNPHARENHFTLLYDVTSEKYTAGMETDHYREGQNLAFIGHSTQSGAQMPTIPLTTSDPVASKLSTLLMLRDWTNQEEGWDNGVIRSNLHLIIDLLIASYTATPVHQMAPFGAARRGGTATHRLRCHGFEERVVANCLENTFTLMTGESNTHTVLRMDPKNLTINFLQLYCQSVMLATMDLNYSAFTTCPPVMWIETLPCSYCDEPICEDPIIVDPALVAQIYIPTLKATAVGASVETAIREGLEKFSVSTCHPVGHPFQVEDLEIAQMAIVWEVLAAHWITTGRMVTRYSMHKTDPSAVMTAENVSGFVQTQRLSQNDLRAIPMDVIIRVLTYAIFDYFDRNSPASTPAAVAQIIATKHESDLPWYGVLSWIELCGFIQQFLLKVADSTGVSVPSGAVTHLGSATRYVGQALFGFQPDSGLRTYVVTMAHHDTPGILRDRLERLAGRILRVFVANLESTNELHPDLPLFSSEEMLCQYLALLAPVLPPADLTEALGGPTITCVEIELFTPGDIAASDITALSNPGHARHRLIQDWLSRFKNGAPSARKIITETSIQDFMDLIPLVDYTLCPNVTVYKANLSTCCALVRGNPVVEEKQVDVTGHIDPTFQVIPPPPIRVPCESGWTEEIPSVGAFDPLRVTSQPQLKKCVKPNLGIRYTDALRTLGTTTTSVCKFLDIMTRVGWRLFPSDIVGNIVCCAEGQGGIASACLQMFPKCHVFFNTLATQYRTTTLAGIAMLENNESQRLHQRTQSQGVNDLTEWETIETLQEEIGQRFALLHCDADLPAKDRALTATLIWGNIAGWFAQQGDQNAILVLKVFADLPTVVAALCTWLRKVTPRVYLMRSRCSHPGPELYIVAQLVDRSAGTLTGRPRFAAYHGVVAQVVHRMVRAIDRLTADHNAGRPGQLSGYYRRMVAIFNAAKEYVRPHYHHIITHSLALSTPPPPGSRPWEVTIRAHLAEINDNIATATHQVNSRQAEMANDPTSHSRTLTHMVVVARRSFRLAICHYILSYPHLFHPETLSTSGLTLNQLVETVAPGWIQATRLPWRHATRLADTHVAHMRFGFIEEALRAVAPAIRLIGSQDLDIWDEAD